jgi:flagellin
MMVSANVAPGVRTLSTIISQYNNKLEESLGKIASGLRVRKPSDDAYNYFRGEDLRIRSNMVERISSGLGDHLARLKSAEGSLLSIRELLTKMSSMAAEAGEEENDSVRAAMGKEYDQMLSAVVKLVETSRYNGKTLLDASWDSGAGGSAISARIDENTGDHYRYDILDTRALEATGLNLAGFASAEADWGQAGATGRTSATDYAEALENQDSGMKRMDRNLNRISTHLTVLEGVQNALANRRENYLAARSALVEVNQAEETSRYTSMQIQQQAAASFLAQANLGYAGVVGLLLGKSQ